MTPLTRGSSAARDARSGGQSGGHVVSRSSTRCMSSTARARSAPSSCGEVVVGEVARAVVHLDLADRLEGALQVLVDGARAAAAGSGGGSSGRRTSERPGDRDDDRERHRGEDDRAGDHARARPPARRGGAALRPARARAASRARRRSRPPRRS